MGMRDKLDQLKEKGQEVAGDRSGQADDAIDRGANIADEKTGGRHSKKIDKAAQGAKRGGSKLGKK